MYTEYTQPQLTFLALHSCSGFNLKTEVSRNAGLDRLLGNVLQINNYMTNNLLYFVIWLETEA